MRDLGRAAERPRADEEEQTAEDSALMLLGTCSTLHRERDIVSRLVSTESWDKHFVATRYGGRRGGGEASCGLRWDKCHFTCSTAHDASGVFDEELYLGAMVDSGAAATFSRHVLC